MPAQSVRHRLNRRTAQVWGPPLFALILLLWRLAFPARSLEATGPGALADAAFAVGLLLFCLYTARGLGRLLLRAVGVGPVDALLGLVLFLAGGFGILAYGVLALGLLGLLRPTAIFLWLAVAFAIAWWETLRQGVPWGDAFAAFRHLAPGLKAGVGAALVVFAMSMGQALTPVWDYDGLMYHLQGPALFLRVGRLVLLPDLWQANGPLTAEMLFLVGLAAKSEVFAKVLHLTLAALLVVAVFAVARRHLRDRAAWIAAGILLGVPILPVWGSLAYADMAWALFEFLALAAFLEWRASPRRGWLVASGLMLGWAMGSKYTALPLFPILLLAVLLDSRAGSGLSRVRCALWLGGTSLIAASPWYVKNLLLGGNPFYPFLLGGTEWPAERLRILMVYLQSFGTGRSLVDYLTLPVSLLTQRAAFGTFMSRIDIPSPLFLIALAFPVLGRNHPFRPLGWMALLRFAFWAAGTQQTRFLLPLYPVLSLLCAAVLEAWIAQPRARRWRQTAVTGIVAGLVGVTLAYQVIFWVDSRPAAVVAGLESKDAFLRRSVYDYPAMRHIAASLAPGAVVYAAWDGQGYYCGGRCLADAEQSQWVQLSRREGTVERVAARLHARGVTHVLLDREGMAFMLNHDPTGQHAEAASFFEDSFAPACLVEIERYEKVVLYGLACS